MLQLKGHPDPARKLATDATTTLTIVKLQQNLKSATITVKYTDAATGTPKQLIKTAWVHQSSGFAHE